MNISQFLRGSLHQDVIVATDPGQVQTGHRNPWTPQNSTLLPEGVCFLFCEFRQVIKRVWPSTNNYCPDNCQKTLVNGFSWALENVTVTIISQAVLPFQLMWLVFYLDLARHHLHDKYEIPPLRFKLGSKASTLPDRCFLSEVSVFLGTPNFT